MRQKDACSWRTPYCCAASECRRKFWLPFIQTQSAGMSALRCNRNAVGTFHGRSSPDHKGTSAIYEGSSRCRDVYAEAGVRNITAYNDAVEAFNKTNTDPEKEMKKMPYIVVIIDELADLMMIAGKEVEASIQRITQLARASGIHLIVATQRPSTDVITGIIKSKRYCSTCGIGRGLPYLATPYSHKTAGIG